MSCSSLSKKEGRPKSARQPLPSSARNNLAGQSAYTRHKNQVAIYDPDGSRTRNSEDERRSRNKTDWDLLKQEHQLSIHSIATFIREDETGSTVETPSESLTAYGRLIAKRYEESLFKEYALVDLKHYKSGQVALRWRTPEEVIGSIGSSTCGSLRCAYHLPPLSSDAPPCPPLEAFELPFSYVEKEEAKTALVKVVCSSGMLSSNSPSAASSSSTTTFSSVNPSSSSPKRRNAPPPLDLQANQHQPRPSSNSPLKQSFTPTSARTYTTISSASSPSTPGFGSSTSTSASSSFFSSSVKELTSSGHQSTPSSSGFKFWKKRSVSGANVSSQSSTVAQSKSALDSSRQQKQRDQHQHQSPHQTSDSLPSPLSTTSSHHRIQRKPNSVQTYPFDLRASSSEDTLPSRRSGAFFDKSYHWTQAEGPMPPFPDGFSSMRDLRSASSSQLDLVSEGSSMKESERRFVSTRRTGGSVESPAMAFGKGWGENPMNTGSPNVVRNRNRGHERKRSNSMSNLPESLPSRECLISPDTHPQSRRSSASSSFPSRRPSSAQHRVLHSTSDQSSATSSKMTSTRRKPSSVIRPVFTSPQASPQTLHEQMDDWCRILPTEPIESLGLTALPTFIVVPATPDLGSNPNSTEELDSELVTDEQSKEKQAEEEEEGNISDECKTPTNASDVSFHRAATPPISPSPSSSLPSSSITVDQIKTKRSPLLLDLSADDLGFNFASSFSFDSSFSFSELKPSTTLPPVASAPSMTEESSPSSSSSSTCPSPVASPTVALILEPPKVTTSPASPPVRPSRSIPPIPVSVPAEVALPELVSSTSCFSTSSGFTSDEYESPLWEHPELQVNVIPEEDIDEVDDQLDRLLASLSVDNLQTPKASPNLSESTSVASLASILASSPTAFDHFPLPPPRSDRNTPSTSFSAPMLTGQSGLGFGIEAGDKLDLEPRGRLPSPMLVRDHRKPFYLRQERSYSDRTGLKQIDDRVPLQSSVRFNQDVQITVEPSVNQPSSKSKNSSFTPSLPSAGSIDSNLSLYSTDLEDEDGEDSTSCQHGDLESVEIREMERVDFRVVFARSTKPALDETMPTVMADQISEKEAVAL
ncbi:Uncharacterized conserved protein [Phaffia rhodozyma]|uniref:Uncharacterized conserved protein n=1 Tax=Phaffia rhodozyma TaxID=264483 RepID=A0A0F7SPQ4_PHARH|nr:Uncharacterized conserved protein [Phaffia rhodozyma]